MDDEQASITRDIRTFERWLSAPDLGRAEWREDLSFLVTDADAREYLDGIKRSLEAIEGGRVVSHAKVRLDVEERRRRYGADVAE